MDFIISHKVQILSILVVFEQVLPMISIIPGNSSIQMIIEVVKKFVSSIKKEE